jgi:hypothetical protein
MKGYLYYQVANMINVFSQNFEVRNIHQRRIFATVVLGRIRFIPSRSLTIRVRNSYSDYRKGTMWHISELNLRQAAVAISKHDRDFKRRLKNDLLNLEDMQELILQASYGIIVLDLFVNDSINKKKTV